MNPDLAAIAKAYARHKRREALMRSLGRFNRAFWLSFWRSMGWAVPVYIAAAIFLRHHGAHS